MMTMAVHRSGKARGAPGRQLMALAALLVLGAAFGGCASEPKANDEQRMQEFLNRHRHKEWIRLTPEKIQEMADLKQHLDDAREQRERARASEHKVDNRFGYSEPVGPALDEDAAESDAHRSSGPSVEAPGPIIDGKELPAEPMLDFRDVALKDIVRMVARSEGLDVLVPEALDQKVTVSLRSTNPMTMLQSILEQNGMQLVTKESGLRVVEPIKVAAVKADGDVKVRAFTLNSIPVATVEEPLRKLVSPEGKLVINSTGTSFIMMDHPENLKMMEDYVSLLDVRERQVLVEARIIEARLETDDELGVMLQALGADIENVTLTAVQDLSATNKAISVGVAYGREPIAGVLTAIASRRLVNILSAPKVATINGKKATMEVIEKIPYVQSTATTNTSTTGAGSSTVTQIAFEEVGVLLTVTPTVGQDDTIKMEIQPEVRAVTSFFNGVPVVDRRKVTTNIMVKNGGTILIGGILREDEIEDETKTPLLGDLPLLGFLFRRNERRHEKSELIVMITPTIIRADGQTPEDADEGGGGTK